MKGFVLVQHRRVRATVASETCSSVFAEGILFLFKRVGSWLALCFHFLSLGC